MMYGIATTAFHGGGLLFRTRSPRQLVKQLPKYCDGCFNKKGCQGFVASLDEGETWYPIMVLIVGIDGWPLSMATHQYADMALYVEEPGNDPWSGPLKAAHQCNSALSLAL